jgi:hypothetical protein
MIKQNVRELSFMHKNRCWREEKGSEGSGPGAGRKSEGSEKGGRDYPNSNQAGRKISGWS